MRERYLKKRRLKNFGEYKRFVFFKCIVGEVHALHSTELGSPVETRTHCLKLDVRSVVKSLVKYSFSTHLSRFVKSP